MQNPWLDETVEPVGPTKCGRIAGQRVKGQGRGSLLGRATLVGVTPGGLVDLLARFESKWGRKGWAR